VRPFSIVAAGLVLAVLATAGAAQAAAPELSVASNLENRRYVAIGDRAYSVGFEDGRYYAQGWHIRGEMGGFWSAPIKLLDGLWFGVDNAWVGSATRFTSGAGYVQMDLPTTAGVQLRRTEFAPDGHRVVLVGLRMQSRVPRSFVLKVDAHSELMFNYPWGWTTPSAKDFNLPDTGSASDGGLLFREQGTPPFPNANAHDWAAFVRAGAGAQLLTAMTGPGHFGPQDGQAVCQPDAAWADPCRDSFAGKGTGGQLRYRVDLARNEATTLWFAVAGSETGPAAARARAAAVLADPQALLDAKRAEREDLDDRTRLTLTGNQNVAAGIDWSKQNLADSVQRASDMKIRDVDEGRAYPAPLGTLAEARWLGAGWPDYPWLFGTDGEYTAYASVAVGQFEPIQDHLRALKNVSLMANGNSGKVVHEVMHEGSIYFGVNRHAGNTDETAKFPSAVAEVWRWSGDDAFLNEMYAFTKRNMEHVMSLDDGDADPWPEGLGNVERSGMGPEKLDNAVYTVRGMADLADMARFRGDAATVAWADALLAQMRAAFEGDWWITDPGVTQYADSRSEADEKQLRRHWIGVTPMDVELRDATGAVEPGLAAYGNAIAALDLRHEPCFSNENGMFHTGSDECDDGPPSPSEKDIFTLNTAIIANGEGNYGRLGEQDRWLDDNVALQLESDEMPGAMPERASAPAYGTNVGKPYTERGMVLQAWGAYGTAWPVVRQQLGVRPDLGRDALSVVPQVPPSGPVQGEDIRLGDGALALVRASRDGAAYPTELDTGDAPVTSVVIGHTLPRGATVASATLDGAPVAFATRTTNRGVEVTAQTTAGDHTLDVTAG
jgi:hypothetical protein